MLSVPGVMEGGPRHRGPAPLEGLGCHRRQPTLLHRLQLWRKAAAGVLCKDGCWSKIDPSAAG